jgi:hypothetical protein
MSCDSLSAYYSGCWGRSLINIIFFSLRLAVLIEISQGFCDKEEDTGPVGVNYNRNEEVRPKFISVTLLV